MWMAGCAGGPLAVEVSGNCGPPSVVVAAYDEQNKKIGHRMRLESGMGDEVAAVALHHSVNIEISAKKQCNSARQSWHRRLTGRSQMVQGAR